MTRGVLLGEMTWLEAERVLTDDTVVVLPIGAAAKEHGPHLLLKNDLLIANYMRDRVLEVCDVVVAPTLGYHHYPAFAEYPGSTSLRQDTARDVVIDICRSLAAFGPRRFYILNTGVSTVRALAPAIEELATFGILARYTDLGVFDAVDRAVGTQKGGTHADEIETSMMLVIAPDTVDMTKAQDDYDPRGLPGLSRDPNTGGTYSPSGIFGNATLATVEKGRIVVETWVNAVCAEIESLASLPVPKPHHSELSQLAECVTTLTQATAKRDEIICEARRQGFSLRRIADAADVSHMTVQHIVDRETDPEVS